MAYLPLMLDLTGIPALVVGGGEVALRKVGVLLEAGADLSVVTPWARDEIVRLAGRGELRLVSRTYEDADLEGVRVVVAATDCPSVNTAVCAEASRRGIWANSVDGPEGSSALFPALLRRGDLVVAVSTSGGLPSLSRRLKEHLGRRIGADWRDRIEEICALRQEILRKFGDDEMRKRRQLEDVVGTRIDELMRDLDRGEAP